jgi:hypothetical protein
MDKEQIIKEANNLYNQLNQNIGTDFIDAIYPNHDGVADHNAAAKLMELRQSLYSVTQACDMVISHLTEAIDLYDENEK